MIVTQFIKDNKDQIIRSSLSVVAGVSIALLLDQIKKLVKKDQKTLESQSSQFNGKAQSSQNTSFDGFSTDYSIDGEEDYLKDPRTLQRLKIQNAGEMTNNALYEELKFLENDLCEIIRVDHLAWNLDVSEFPNIISPLLGDGQVRSVLGGEGFLPSDSFVYKNSFVLSHPCYGPELSINDAKRWLRAGPRKNIFFEPSEVKALIITCHGLCPGTNTVIREIAMSLHYNYKAKEIYGSEYGFSGLLEENGYKLIQLLPQKIKTIHQQGGSILGSSKRYKALQNVKLIVDNLVKNGINQLYILGDYGIYFKIDEIYQEITRRQLKISICGIPKVADKEFPIIDTSFGFETVIEEACKVIKAAQVNSSQNEYGLSVVRVIGKGSGWCCMFACLAARNVDVCLIPEIPFDLYGKDGVFEHVAKLVQNKKHVQVVVSEGAANGSRDVEIPEDVIDAFGNYIRLDFGAYFTQKVREYIQVQKKIDLNVKYIDARNIMITPPANSYDTKIASSLAQNSVNGMMSGFTFFTAGLVNNLGTLLNNKDILSGKHSRVINPDDRMWQRLLASTCQPNFLNKEKYTIPDTQLMKKQKK